MARLKGLVDLLGIEGDNAPGQKKILKMINDSADELDGIIRQAVRKVEKIKNRTGWKKRTI